MLGVDGCKAGWVGALLRGSTYDVLVAADIAGLVDAARQLAPGLAVVAVDIPIGLPDDRPRTTDVLARSQLPVGRKSSVFPTPSRAAVEHTTHPEASAANREAVGVGLSVQAFHLVPKILDVDRYVARGTAGAGDRGAPGGDLRRDRPGVRGPVEGHPRADTRRVAAHSSAVGLDPPAHQRGQGYAADDLLDACAVAWTAARYAADTAYSLPDPPEVFSDGIPAAIWV